ncbi:unnamed protein product [Lupinus luteus]|uniref:Uncharacterized protein n=1 Tax=Lupinus luteus TaxID=3873 RepID=A0AAV1X9D8_LUPLU
MGGEISLIICDSPNMQFVSDFLDLKVGAMGGGMFCARERLAKIFHGIIGSGLLVAMRVDSVNNHKVMYSRKKFFPQVVTRVME